MDKKLRNTIIAGILLISVPFAYYFLIAPFKKNYNFNKCLENSQDYFGQKQNEINSHLENLNQEKEIIQKEVDEKLKYFYQNNSKPKIEDYPIFKSREISNEYSSKIASWRMKEQEIKKDLIQIKSNIRLIESDYEKISFEKKNEIIFAIKNINKLC
jgi:hypothetical protein